MSIISFLLIIFSKGIFMSEINTKIGEHSFKITCHSTELIGMLKRNFHIDSSDSDFETNMTMTIEEGYGVPFKDFDVQILKEPNRIMFRRADYLIEVDSDYKTANISVYNDFALKHALMNLYSSFIVYHNWGLLLHSSCVIENGKSHIFAGQSGAGKSTAAKLSYPRPLLSDEATILKITSNGVIVFNSPFRSELASSDDRGKHTQLGSIQILYQALQNNREPLKKSDAYLSLIDKVFYWTNNQEEVKRVLQLLKLLVNYVPVYKLYFQKNNQFWELIS